MYYKLQHNFDYYFCDSSRYWYWSPNPWKVIGNSEKVGDLNNQNLKGRYEAKLEISGGGGSKEINFFGGGGMNSILLEPHN